MLKAFLTMAKMFTYITEHLYIYLQFIILLFLLGFNYKNQHIRL
ncbi:hypothetical protein HMP0015_0556 [Acinetobacter haemolyticus ATCC 19194]|uniref:Uncharacterized protein n=1 Tax=Acinetobacter haemolyticus ATCC 19194 TaxID=707232 RepID=D4XLG4_ACIHA|nr:hypothetical protein HMP0015_0556 [Acinetobacter haemolyticus ATCC 19194]